MGRSMTTGSKNKRNAAAGPRRPTAMDARIGVLIRERRLALSLRQEDLAVKLQITQHQLQKYETGENRIAASRLLDCARALATPVAWFFQSVTQAGITKSATEPVLLDDELSLVIVYRGLSPDKKAQLIGIARLLRDGCSIPVRNTRRP